MKRLKNKTDIFPAEPYKVIFSHLLYMASVYNDFALCRPLKSRQHVEKCWFPGSAGADDRTELAPVYLEAHSVQGPDGGISHAVQFVEVFYSDRFYRILPLSFA